jgi:hypothetical protein
VRRLFWLATGVGAGVTSAVLVNRWMREQARRVAPSSLAKQAGALGRDVLSLVGASAQEFRQGATERESELRNGHRR